MLRACITCLRHAGRALFAQVASGSRSREVQLCSTVLVPGERDRSTKTSEVFCNVSIAAFCKLYMHIDVTFAR